MENTPTLQTERLLLRRFTVDDLEAFYLIGSDKTVNTFLPLFPFATMEEAKTHLQDKYLRNYENLIGFRYAICLKSNNIPIGYVNIHDNDSNDLGYGLRKEFWQITEACMAVLKQLKDVGFSYITATHDINNPRSGNVMQKIGMTYRYSYEELWQPKNILVTFRMYQLNLDGHEERVYKKYWEMSKVHFVETGL